MAAELRRSFPEAEIQLTPGRGGCFEVSHNGRMVYSKNATGQFPQDGEVLERLKAAE